MDKNRIIKLLYDFKKSKISEKDAVKRLKSLPFEDLSFAKVDNHRSIRTGFPEVIFCQGKTMGHICEIFIHMREYNENILLTRANSEIYAKLKEIDNKVQHHSLSNMIVFERKPLKKKKGILVITAGTADIPVAEEAAVTAEITGNKVERIYDVGVAGIHRLLAYKESIFSATCIIVVAGMEGALPSVVGGLASCPVIAVPTSVGYGTNLGGIAPLLTMMNSCSPNIAVVNIDNGFGAGYIASMINKK